VGGEIDRRDTEHVSGLLNQRLAGLTLQQIRESFVDRMREVQDDKSGLIRLFIDSVDQLYADEKSEKLHISGTQNIIEQPEFVDPKNFRGVIELIENEDMIVHLLEKRERTGANLTITIGSENPEQAAREYGVVTTIYDVDGVSGSVGIIGPRRMNYAKLVPLVEHVAKTIARIIGGQGTA